MEQLETPPNLDELVALEEKAQYEGYMEKFGLKSEEVSVPILDVGSGGGFFIQYLRRHLRNRNAYGVELNQPTMPAGVPREGIVTADVRKLPFADGTFELVVARAFMGQFLWQDPIPVLDEMLRVLKPGGRAMFDVQTREELEDSRARNIREKTATSQFDDMLVGLGVLKGYLESIRERCDVSYGENQVITVTKHP